jgi:hypothetical protein
MLDFIHIFRCMNQSPNKLLYFFAPILFFFASCGNDIPDHAGMIDEDAWLLMTFRPESLMEKSNYKKLMKEGVMSNAPAEAKVLITALSLDDPAEAGVDLGEDIYVFMGGNPDDEKSIKAGVIFALSDVEKFKNTFGTALELAKKGMGDQIKVTKSEKEGLIIHSFEGGGRNPALKLLHDDSKVLFAIGAVDGEKLFKEPNDPDDLPEIFQNHIGRDFEFGVAVASQSMIKAVKQSMSGKEREAVEAMSSWFSNAGASYELSSDEGEILVRTFVETGDELDFDSMMGDGVPDEMVELVPKGSMAAVSLSLDLKEIAKIMLPKIREFAKTINGQVPDEFPANLDYEIPQQGFTIDDVLTAVPGDVVGALVDLPSGNSEMPGFVVAIGHSGKDSDAYEKVFKGQGIMALKVIGAGLGLTISDEDEYFVVKSPGLSSGDSVSGDKSDALSDSAMGMFVDLKKVSSEAVKIMPSRAGAEEKMLMSALGNFDLLTFVVHDHESATIKLVFSDKDEEGFAQATDMILGLIAFQKVAGGNFFGGGRDYGEESNGTEAAH